LQRKKASGRNGRGALRKKDSDATRKLGRNNGLLGGEKGKKTNHQKKTQEKKCQKNPKEKSGSEIKRERGRFVMLHNKTKNRKNWGVVDTEKVWRANSQRSRIKKATQRIQEKEQEKGVPPGRAGRLTTRLTPTSSKKRENPIQCP